jgi:serine/threonine-protein kinase
VIRQLEVSLNEPERRAVEARPTENLEAYQAYLRGLDYHRRTSATRREDYNLAIQMYQMAVELDPGFALAYAELSKVHSRLYHNVYDRSEERLTSAREAAKRALRLQPDLPEAHLALGYYYYRCLRDYESALEELAIAEKGLPNDPRILEAVAYIQRRRGERLSAIENLEEAFQLDPQDARLAGELGSTLFGLRRYEEADSYFDRAIFLSPDYGGSYGSKMFNTLLWKGDTDEARAILLSMPGGTKSDNFFWWYFLESSERNFEAVLTLLDSSTGDALDNQHFFCPHSLIAGEMYAYMGEPELARASFDSALAFLESRIQEKRNDARFQSSLGIVYAHLGRAEEAIREGDRGVELCPISKDALLAPTRIFDLAVVYVLVGEHDNAIDQIEQILSIPGPFSVHSFRLDPTWDPLREHPRFQKVLEEYAH